MFTTSQDGPSTDHGCATVPAIKRNAQRERYHAQLNPVRISIARLTDQELAVMSAHELVELLACSAMVAQWAELLRELPKAGRSGLLRLAILARRRCRDEIESIHDQYGRPTPHYV